MQSPHPTLHVVLGTVALLALSLSFVMAIKMITSMVLEIATSVCS